MESENKRHKTNSSKKMAASSEGITRAFENDSPEGILSFFWTLADESADARNDSCRKMLIFLQTEQEAMGTASERSESLDYALKRLVKGLCSSRKRARQGFSQALTEIMVTFKEAIPTRVVSDLADKHIILTSGANRQQTKDYYIGYAFFIQVLLFAGRLNGIAASDSDYVENIVKKLLLHGSTRTVLRTLCFDSIYGVLKAVPGDVAKDTVFPILLPLFADKAVKDLNPDELSLALAMNDIVGSKGSSKDSNFPPFIFSLRSEKHVSQLVQPLQASVSSHPFIHSVWSHLLDPLLSKRTSDVTVFSAFWTTTVEEALTDSEKDLTHATLLKRKHLALQLFSYCISKLASLGSPSPLLPVVFSYRVLSSLLNILSNKKESKKKDPALYHCALGARQSILNAANSGSEQAMALVELLSERSPNFDLRTHTSTIGSILRNLEASGVSAYVRSQIARFNSAAISSTEQNVSKQEDEDQESQEKGTAVERVRAGIIQQLCAVAKNKMLKTSDPAVFDGWERSLIRFFLLRGFFKYKEQATSSKKSKAEKNSKKVEDDVVEATLETPPSALTQSLIAKRFHEIVGDLSPSKKGKAVNISVWVSAAHEEWTQLKAKYELMLGLTESEEAARSSAIALCSKIDATVSELSLPVSNAESEPSKPTRSTRTRGQKEKEPEDVGPQTAVEAHVSQLSSFKCLLLNCALILLTDAEEATSCIEELLLIYARMFSDPSKEKKGKEKKKKKEKKLNGEMEAAIEEVPKLEPVQVLVDLLLGLLVKPSAHLRELSSQVFSAFAGKMTSSALLDLMAQLNIKTQIGKEEEEEEDEDGTPFTEGDLKERESQQEGGSEEENESDDDDDDKDEDEDDDDDDKDEMPSKPVSKKAKTSDEESSDEEVGLDDALESEFDNADQAIQSMVLMRKQQRQQAKELHREKIHFKFRIIDLIENFIKRAHQLSQGATSCQSLLLCLFEPMLEATAVNKAAKGCTADISALHKSLCDRLQGVYKNKLCRAVSDWAGKEKTETDGSEEVQALSEKLMARAKASVGRDTLALVNCGLLACVKFFGNSEVIADANKTTTTKSKKSKVKTNLEATTNEVLGIRLYREAFREFMLNKNSKLNTKFFMDFISRFPAQAHHLATSFVSFSEKACNDHTREQSLVLLQALLQHRNVLTVETLEEISKALVASSVKSLASVQPLLDNSQAAAQPTDGDKAKKLMWTLKLCRLQVRLCSTLYSIITKKAGAEKANELIASAELRKHVEKLPDAAAKELNNVLGNFCSLLGWTHKANSIQHLNPKKRKNKLLLDSGNGNVGDGSKKRKTEEETNTSSLEGKKIKKDKKNKKDPMQMTL